MRSVWLDGFWGLRPFPAGLRGFGPYGDISWDGTTEVYVDYRDRLSLFFRNMAYEDERLHWK